MWVIGDYTHTGRQQPPARTHRSTAFPVAEMLAAAAQGPELRVAELRRKQPEFASSPQITGRFPVVQVTALVEVEWCRNANRNTVV